MSPVCRLLGTTPSLAKLLILLVLAGLAGCALPGDSTPPAQAYLLTADGPVIKPATRASAKILLITPPRAAPGFDTNGMAYTRQPPKLDYYRDSVWGDTPARMLQPVLVNAFETTSAFKAVVTTAAPTLADLRVDVELLRLQQEFISQPSQLRLTVRTQIMAAASGQVLGTQVFDVAIPAPSEDANGAARAANTAVRTVLEQLVPFVLSAL